MARVEPREVTAEPGGARPPVAAMKAAMESVVPACTAQVFVGRPHRAHAAAHAWPTCSPGMRTSGRSGLRSPGRLPRRPSIQSGYRRAPSATSKPSLRALCQSEATGAHWPVSVATTKSDWWQKASVGPRGSSRVHATSFARLDVGARTVWPSGAHAAMRSRASAPHGSRSTERSYRLGPRVTGRSTPSRAPRSTTRLVALVPDTPTCASCDLMSAGTAPKRPSSAESQSAGPPPPWRGCLAENTTDGAWLRSPAAASATAMRTPEVPKSRPALRPREAAPHARTASTGAILRLP
mmetsp:Transcript_9862/g.33446  ORF Transcript_9862/g.33446 Transcript_9862/m.33446 type:complete len:295 (-) Transcript_9862:8-892(-)